MRLIRCHIENFGKLHHVDFDFVKGCNLFLEKNGWGKSTLAAFIKVMFYGFRGERAKDGVQNERKRYRPWQGGVYGGSIWFEADGKEYLVTRTFGTKEKEDRFSIRDGKTNLETTDFTSKLGEELFQIDQASFLRTVFLSQNDCVTSCTDSIQAKITNLAENTDDINNYEKVDERLNSLLNAMSPSRKTGSLFKMKEEMAVLEMEIRAGSHLEQTLDRLLEEKSNENAKYQSLKAEQKELLEKQDKINAWKDLQARKEIYDHLLEDYTARKISKEEKRRKFGMEIPSERDVLEHLQLCGKLSAEEKLISIYQLNEDEKRRLYTLEKLLGDGNTKAMSEPTKSGIFLKSVLGVIGLLAGGYLYSKAAAASAFIILSGVAILIWAAVQFKQKNTFMEMDVYNDLVYKRKAFDGARKNTEILRNKIGGFLEFYGGDSNGDFYQQLVMMLGQVREYENAFFEFEKTKQQIDQFEEKNPIDKIQELNILSSTETIEQLDGKLDQILIALENTSQNVVHLEKQLEELRQRKDEIDQQEEKLGELRHHFEKQSEKYLRLKKTREYLALAKITFTAKYMKPLQNNFSKYYEILTGETSEQYHMDANIAMTVEEQGMQRDSRLLSSGCQDLAGICVRMALIDAMYKKEKPFILLDDPFVNLDEEKTKGGLKLLETIGKDYQVIYFTCHESRK